ncbi:MULTISPECIES: MarR family transcriptional regulator [Auritidibacter]|uniref:MarR family transcriptional regulator n=1 Tax=Auritidibacter TaxID=1160973 RepID=UPI001304D8CF
MSEYNVLLAFAEAQEQKLTRSELVRETVVSPSWLTYSVTVFHQRGLVARQQSLPTDERSKGNRADRPKAQCVPEGLNDPSRHCLRDAYRSA